MIENLSFTDEAVQQCRIRPDRDERAEPKHIRPPAPPPSPARRHMSALATRWHLEKAPKDSNQIMLYGHGVLQMLHNPPLRADFP